jgi:hypothetical protein
MSTRSRPPQAPVPAPEPTGPEGRNVWVAVGLGLVLGQAGYLYTRQGKRFFVSMVIGSVAILISLLIAYQHLPPFDLDAMTQDPTAITNYSERLTTALGLPSLVGLLNNLVCAIDLYLQVEKANRLYQPL